MRRKIEWKWEKLDEATYRIKVIGGWLVLHTNSIAITDGKNKSTSQSESMQFISDKDHEWTIAPSMKELEEKAKQKDISKDFE